VARQLLQKHRKTYSVFWSWLENRVNRAMLTNEQETVFGWKHRFRERPKPNTVKNFFMQGNGSEMLKLACCLGTEGGISICAPVHDAILMQAPIDHWEEDVARMRAYMAEASRIVLNGFVLPTEQHVFPHPEHYSDPQGRGRLMLETDETLMKMIDPKDFILSPEELADMKKSPTPASSHKQKRGLEFYQFPKTILIAVFRANYMPALALVMAIYEGWYRDFKKRNPVRLTSDLLAEFGVSKDQKSKALKVLEQSGFFVVERFHRRNPLVMMKWILPKD
jgi:hypothetical protein